MLEFGSLDPEQAFQVCTHVVDQIIPALVDGTKGLVEATRGVRALQSLVQAVRQLAQGTKPQAKALAFNLTSAESDSTDENVRTTLAMRLMEMLRADSTSARQILEFLDQLEAPVTEFAGTAKAKGEDSDEVIAGDLSTGVRVLPGGSFESEGKNVKSIIGVRIRRG